MGCDYYILKLLRIYHSENEYLEIELDRERGYYDDIPFDEDADDYEDKLNEYIEQILTPKMSPITIYANNSFNKSSCESIYKGLVENEISKLNMQWGDITKIIKVEERRER
jgi:hypothetical protein